MCKPWPGLRCADHPHQKIQKLNFTIQQREEELSKLDDALNELGREYGENAETYSDYQTLKIRRELLLDKIKVSEEKREHESLNYVMSAGGRKELKEIIENPTSTPEVKTDAAAELAVAEARIKEQKDMGKVIKDKTIPDEEKEAYLEIQQEMQEKKIRRLRKEEMLASKELKSIELRLSRMNPEWESYGRLKQQHTELAVKLAYIKKEVKQRESLKQEIKKFKAQYKKQWEAKYQKMSRRFLRIVDFVLQPNRKPAW